MAHLSITHGRRELLHFPFAIHSIDGTVTIGGADMVEGVASAVSFMHKLEPLLMIAGPKLQSMTASFSLRVSLS
jgi:hypothetical protein